MRSLKLVGTDVADIDVAQACMNHALTRVELENCDRVTDLSALATVPTLEEVHIRDCRRVRCFGPLGQTKTTLRKLVLSGTPVTKAQLRELTRLGQMELVVDNCGDDPKLERPAQSLVKSSIDMIREVAGRFKPEEIGVAFNGGKDSVVMMDLLECALGPEMLSRFCVFTLGASGREEFSEVVAFREAYLENHGLTGVKTDLSLSMKDGLAQLKESKGIALVFMGTRSSDSAHQKKSVEPTTAGWPEMLRACPVFHWGYEDIWGYILAYSLPFCVLYKMGYTSLGLRGATAPNVLLRRGDGTFRPAWELHDDLEERNGREANSS
ncbi:putative phosphoadenosine phosphosulfate reductase-like protein [Trypanosoma cruzi]|uniref:FAD synthase n=2 Tax=Trypanosoma cruzi TaxID=5693 RepID=V5B9Z2_TRYCR|nr:phosphoadenosine phosphosulfate reductase-like protein [Trypanosoma cruzi Dm28c]KAF8281112.1 putative phosphoadenosine phosphosulfate reductase-like protein [Trypanosoma cruzi]PBJ74078.1 phosphoadenosine phosphosulfate reductase-like [Trypanosoma cruzi cruzi]PWU86741.1 putative phosphoadenosine phosphosulfate reductase-like protein [Trypanosoma cruzi]PWU93710.1 putative phosphoadenosine phosphosulfate reductase-like protein [Trypanosoma cruzi]